MPALHIFTVLGALGLIALAGGIIAFYGLVRLVQPVLWLISQPGDRHLGAGLASVPVERSDEKQPVVVR